MHFFLRTPLGSVLCVVDQLELWHLKMWIGTKSSAKDVKAVKNAVECLHLGILGTQESLK